MLPLLAARPSTGVCCHGCACGACSCSLSSFHTWRMFSGIDQRTPLLVCPCSAFADHPAGSGPCASLLERLSPAADPSAEFSDHRAVLLPASWLECCPTACWHLLSLPAVHWRFRMNCPLLLRLALPSCSLLLGLAPSTEESAQLPRRGLALGACLLTALRWPEPGSPFEVGLPCLAGSGWSLGLLALRSCSIPVSVLVVQASSVVQRVRVSVVEPLSSLASGPRPSVMSSAHPGRSSSMSSLVVPVAASWLPACWPTRLGLLRSLLCRNPGMSRSM